jgi:hypothetical protein
VQAAINGTIKPAVYQSYLAEIAQQYAPHSPIVMSLAASRCMQSHRQLAEYLLKHAAEERGHNQWALEDLNARRVSMLLAQKARPVPACAAMIAYEYFLAEHGNPVALFGWMYILEAVGADLGPDATKGLRKAQMPVRFVAGHAQADQKHATEILAQIKANVTDRQDRSDLLYAAEVSAVLYVTMFEQVAEKFSNADGAAGKRSRN